MNLKFYLTHPNELLLRLRYLAWEKFHPSAPWLTPGAVKYLDQVLTPEMTMLEFGSGRSTLWFAKRVGELTSIEYDQNWYEQVQAKLAANQISTAVLKHIPLEHARDSPEPKYESGYPVYVKVLEEFKPHSLDAILVDGHYRTGCIECSVERLKPGGLLIVDDSQRWNKQFRTLIPAHWEQVHTSSNGLKSTSIWQASSQS